MTDSVLSGRKLFFRTKLAYGVGEIAEGLKGVGFDIFLFFYYTQVLGLSGTLAGFALFIALCVDAFSDPILGSLSDGFKSRLGRRHPFLYAAPIPLAIGFFLVFMPPDGLGQAGLFVWLTFFAVVTRVAMTAYYIPHMALGAELTDHFQERMSVTGYRVVFGFVGRLLGLFLGFSLFFVATAEFPNGQFNATAYPGFAAVCALAMGVAIWLSARGTHDQIQYLRLSDRPRPPFGPLRLWRELTAALSSRSFVAVFVAVLILAVINGVHRTLGLHVNTFFWELPSSDIQTLFVATVLGFLCGIPTAGPIARYLDKKLAFILGGVWLLFFMIGPVILRLAGLLPGNDWGLLVAFLATANFLSGVGGAWPAVLSGAMLADLADEHELDHEHRREGIFFGSYAFCVKASSGLGGVLAGIAIDAIGLTPGAKPGSLASETVEGLGYVYGPGLIPIAVIGLIAIGTYRLDKRRHAEILEAIRARQ
jgi:Na+/melibiose symporter-like transporter